MKGLDKHLTTEPEDRFTQFAEQVTEAHSTDFFDRYEQIIGSSSESSLKTDLMKEYYRLYNKLLNQTFNDETLSPESAAIFIESAFNNNGEFQPKSKGCWFQGEFIESKIHHRHLPKETIQKWREEERVRLFCSADVSSKDLNRTYIATFKYEQDLIYAVRCMNKLKSIEALIEEQKANIESFIAYYNEVAREPKLVEFLNKLIKIK